MKEIREINYKSELLKEITDKIIYCLKGDKTKDVDLKIEKGLKNIELDFIYYCQFFDKQEDCTNYYIGLIDYVISMAEENEIEENDFETYAVLSKFREKLLLKQIPKKLF